ncbi:TetR/AcrR family transcriptional regulator [Nocardioides caldifontis]|uniref:TetR/AcrR family transcriptional regulator n=1 Tax=Nocardioides caldifontis TaxID=2588938 RepID=UPI00193A7D0A|nr:TetR/AcrR family transcriptional regulator [Nocardioides caldifontis]
MAGSKGVQGRQAEIMHAAAQLFNDRGFHETSMEDVAAAVGIKKPSLYHHVKSKAQIVGWIHDECVRTVLPPLMGYLEEDIPASEVLRRVAMDIFGLLDSHPGYLRVYFENHRDLDARSKTRITKKRDEYYDAVRRTLQRGNESGELVVENPNLAAMAFFGMCNWGYQWYQADGPESAAEVGEYVWSIYTAGVLAPGTSRLLDGAATAAAVQSA